MKSPFILTLAAISLLTLSARAAEDSKFPDLKGTWVSEYPVYFHNGSGHAKQTLLITEQEGEGFRGVREWTRKDFAPGKEGAKAPKAETEKVPFAGVIDFDGKTLHIVDHGQTSHLKAKLISPDKMQVIFLMPGKPTVVFRATFERVKP
jgi:hypothetical protein